MFMAVWTFIALAVTTIIYAWLGQGGAVSGLIFFGVLLIGVIAKVVLAAEPQPNPSPEPRAPRVRLGADRDELQVLGFDHQGASPRGSSRGSRAGRPPAPARPPVPTCSKALRIGPK